MSPQIASGMAGVGGGGGPVQVPNYTGPGTATGPVTGGDRKSTDTCPDSQFNLYQAIIAGGADVLEWFPKGIAELTATITSFIMAQVLSWPITTGTEGAAAAFAVGWESSRNLANMLIVLGFVVVGIATALRIREYEAKKALWPLIAVALLINFSGFFCGLVIDASQLTMNGLVGKEGANTVSTGTGKAISNMAPEFYDKVSKLEKKINCDQMKKGQLMNYVMTDAMFAFIYVAIAITFLYLSIILIARYAILGILFMLSPLAMAAIAVPFPGVRALWDKWLHNFLQWAFVGVSVAFFLNIAGNMFVGFKITSSIEIGPLAGYLGVALMTIVVGVMISAKQNGIASMASKAVVGAATGVAGFAMGAVAGGAAGVGKAIDRKTGGHVANLGQRMKTGTRNSMARLGFISNESAAAANSKDVEEHAKGMSVSYAAAKASGNTGEMARIQDLARTGKGARGAGAMRAISDAKDTDKVFGNDLGSKAQRISYAEASGATGIREKEEKLDPRLKGYSPQAVKEHGSAAAAVAAGYSKASREDIQNYSEETLKDKAFATNVLLRNPRRVSKAAENMNQNQIAAIKSEHQIRVDGSGRSLPLAQQGDGVKAMYAEMNKHPLGSAERAAVRKKIVDAQHEMINNPFLA